jgi:hypothetical protein
MTDGLIATVHGLLLRSVFLPVVLWFLVSASAWGDIYKWTDTQGNTVISNILPVNPKQAANVEKVLKEPNPVPQSPAGAANRVATPTEQMLLDRIDSLERRLQAKSYTSPPQVTYPSDYGSYYLPPPPPASDYNYGYSPMPLYSYPVYPVRTFVTRPAFAHAQGRSFRGAAIHRRR